MSEIMQQYSELKKQSDQRFFYKEQGKTIIQIGNATCENAAGSQEVKKIFENLIAASGRDDILLKQTGCTGRCAQEPIVGVFVDNEIPVKYQKVSKDKAPIIFQQHVLQKKPVLDYILDKKTKELYDFVVTFCTSSRCRIGQESWKNVLVDCLNQKSFPINKIRIYEGGCLGLCRQQEKSQHGVMMIYPQRVIYHFTSRQQLEEIVDSHFILGKICKNYQVTKHINSEDFFKLYGDVSFFNKQTRITLRNCGIVDPDCIDDYIHMNEFQALASVLEKNDPQWVIDQIVKSGLRGRGGGGYPTGLKWQAARKANSSQKYIICNADEGDPGAFMDRSALEGSPFDIIQGMTIGGFAIGASKGFAYIRAEYPLAIERIQNAIDLAKKYKLLGNNILGSNFNFDIEIRLGAGAFVCGEETALMMSIEGQRGQPRIRPPYPTDSGLWTHPTVINNVETLANIPAIIANGANWFANIGTERSKGTKVFALAGKVRNTGLVEVPMGTSLREIIFDIGGGIVDGKKLKAIQTGGPSGGCIPAEKMDTPVEYESLKEIGSMMGSGGMIVLDESDCMVATAKFFLQFTQDESCGKCTPCREGTLRMLEILERITQGNGTLDDLDKLERLGRVIQKTSLCGLGQSAPNPVLSMMKNFRQEFYQHVVEKKCITQRCQALITYTIDSQKCVGCTVCARHCPVSCIEGKPKQTHFIHQDKCIHCGACFNSCKFEAIDKS